MKKQIILSGILLTGAAIGYSQFEQLPHNPEPGKCYIRSVTPDVYETREERVVVRPAYKQFEKVPAEYRIVEERVLVRPAYRQLVIVPATFKTVTKEVEVESSHSEVSLLPPRFGMQLDSIQIYPGTGRWEYQASPENCPSEDPRDCMVLRYVEQPPSFKIYQKRTVEQEASFTRTQKPRQTMTISVQELVSEARTEVVEVPAEYTTVTRRELVRDETVREVEVPAEYQVETVEVLKSKGGEILWEEVDCALIDYTVLPVLYELNSARLTPESRSVIDGGLLKLLREKPNIRIEISAHTDSRGTNEDNRKLSQARAEAVAAYLVSRGIQRSRLVARGFGESRLKNRCADGVFCSEAEHAENRRTEFRVLSN